MGQGRTKYIYPQRGQKKPTAGNRNAEFHPGSEHDTDLLRRRPLLPPCDGRTRLHGPLQAQSLPVLFLPVPLVCSGKAPLQVVAQIGNARLSLSLSSVWEGPN